MNVTSRLRRLRFAPRRLRHGHIDSAPEAGSESRRKLLFAIAGSILGVLLIAWSAPQLAMVLRGGPEILFGGPLGGQAETRVPAPPSEGLQVPPGDLPGGSEQPAATGSPTPAPTSSADEAPGATPAPPVAIGISAGGGPDVPSGPNTPIPIDDPSPPPPPAPAPVTACSDGFDNDGDGYIDLADPECFGPLSGSEHPSNAQPTQMPSPTAPPTTSPAPTPTPVPASPSPTPTDPPTPTPTPTPTSPPTPTPTPMPTSPPTPAPTPTPQATPPPPPPECSDGVDNDGDLLVDWPLDLGCSGPDDDDESGPIL